MEEFGNIVNDLQTSYNLTTLHKVNVHRRWRSEFYSYYQEKKFLWWITQKEGIYKYSWGDSIGPLDTIPDNHVMEETPEGRKIIYEVSECVLTFNNKEKVTYYFKTTEEAKKFKEEVLKQHKAGVVWGPDLSSLL